MSHITCQTDQQVASIALAITRSTRAVDRSEVSTIRSFTRTAWHRCHGSGDIFPFLQCYFGRSLLLNFENFASVPFSIRVFFNVAA